MAFIVVVENEWGEVIEEVARSCDEGPPPENACIEMGEEKALYKVHRVVYADDDSKTTRRKYLACRVHVRPASPFSDQQPGAGGESVHLGGGAAPGRSGSKPKLQLLPSLGDQTPLIREYFSELGADESEIELLCLLRQEVDWQDELGDRMAALNRVEPNLYVESTDPEVIRRRAREVKFRYTELCLQVDARCRAARATGAAPRERPQNKTDTGGK
jgi:hypothetical protein